MDFKVPESEDVIIWFVMGFFATWGGIVQLLIKNEEVKDKRNVMKKVLTQVSVSGFTGILGGLMIFEYGGGYYLAIAISGVFGSLGDVGLLYIQSYFLNGKVNKK
ncbi:phage holin family protein [Yersinia enterocolitica]|uniref:phage holin family protein n=1 Tax=Yersinia enterocolitica TaxID=630 RepID=UPI000976F147|nr:phage holin family protein [Yersinia enterocolitica]ELI7922735.1 phage holin family protein [Yersinia enterocolitica]